MKFSHLLSILSVVIAAFALSAAQVQAQQTISGTITPSSISSGAKVRLTTRYQGTLVATATVSSSGTYQFSGIARGRYYVTPAKTGVMFSPTRKAVRMYSSPISSVNFTASSTTPNSWSVSGTITGGAGSTVTLTGTSTASTVADGSGNFSFAGLANGTYTVTPSKSGYTFTPVSKSVTVNGANATGVNFTATSTTTTYGLSGTISPATSGTGTTVALSGARSASATADTNGNFSFTGLSNGTYTVTPRKSGYTFTPTSRNVTVNGANVTGTNFSASATSSGHSVDLNWVASTSSTVSGYKVYRSSTSGGPYALLNSAPVTSTIYSDLNVTAGATYYYVVTAVDSAGNESTYSNQATAAIPAP